MAFEDNIAVLNEHFFFQEFTYSKATFRPEPGKEVELADSLLWIGRGAVVFQLKEREVLQHTTPNEELAWFKRKVLRNGTRQVRDTVSYLRENASIDLTNHRGHEVTLCGNRLETLHKLVVYLPSDKLPQQCRRIKHHLSRTAGLIHLIPANDYLGIVETLLTPAELMDYLQYRAALITRWPCETEELQEPVLVGHYLHGNLEERPGLMHYGYLQTLTHETEAWDISGIIKVFADRITTAGEKTDYYPIVSAIAELKRNELSEFKKRFVLSIEKAKANEFVQPYRMAIPRTGCGFIFIPLTAEFIPKRQVGLQNFTMAHKYDQKMPRCVGVSFAPDSDGWYLAEWCYLEHPWEPDSELDRLLAESKPFREVKQSELNRYTFRG
jgi:hypothetical protein